MDLPRWRGERDFLTTVYSLSRRRAYIRSARLFVDKPSFERNVRELGRVTADEMYQACEVIGKGEGLKAAMASAAVPDRVKGVLRSLMICMSNVIGTNAHRTTLRHMCSSYRHLFGPPLVFQTPNVADTKLFLVSLMYEDAPVSKWRLLEEEEPDMPGASEMLKRVAADPVSQAHATDVMIQLFLHHILGVQPRGSKGFSDGFASAAKPGVFGQVVAYFGPLETQGRGGLHAHFSVFTVDPVRAHMLDTLRNGQASLELVESLKLWRKAVLEKVASMQFDSVEEVARQLGCSHVSALPFSALDQKRACMDGLPEDEDAGVFSAPTQAAKQHVPHDVLDWRNQDAFRPFRDRPHVAIVDGESAHSGVLSHNPRYRRMPCYQTGEAGFAHMVGIDDVGAEAHRFAKAFAFLS
jgi:hypothetical protein